MKKQFLTFKLDNVQYAVEVFKVQEVLEYKQITKVPCSAVYVEGLISSRGQGISVIDFRKKFALPELEDTKDKRIIVFEITPTVQTQNEEEKTILTFGAIADSVHDVIEMDESAIEPPPKFGNNISVNFIRGIGKNEDEFVIILDIDQIFSTDEIINLENVLSNNLPPEA